MDARTLCFRPPASRTSDADVCCRGQTPERKTECTFSRVSIKIALPGYTDSLSAPHPPDSSHPSRRFGPGCSVPEALFIAVSVGAELVRVGGLRVITPVAAKLAIVPAVLLAGVLNRLRIRPGCGTRLEHSLLVRELCIIVSLTTTQDIAVACRPTLT